MDCKEVCSVKNKQGIIDSLKKLKEYYGAVSIKAEFEAEGSRKDELIMLREFIDVVDLGFIIKIGGCEAVHDLDQCKLLYATGVMAPMIETPFAMKKFKGAFEKVYGRLDTVERIINAETITCMDNYSAILECGSDFLTGVTVGRSDLSASMGIDKENIECKDVFDATKKLLCMSKNAGLITNFGGNIGICSIPFIMSMAPYIDRYETRKVVITPASDDKSIRGQIREALNFELQYLEFKSDYYTNMAREDSYRMKRLSKQIEVLGGF